MNPSKSIREDSWRVLVLNERCGITFLTYENSMRTRRLELLERALDWPDAKNEHLLRAVRPARTQRRAVRSPTRPSAVYEAPNQKVLNTDSWVRALIAGYTKSKPTLSVPRSMRRTRFPLPPAHASSSWPNSCAQQHYITRIILKGRGYGVKGRTMTPTPEQRVHTIERCRLSSGKSRSLFPLAKSHSCTVWTHGDADCSVFQCSVKRRETRSPEVPVYHLHHSAPAASCRGARSQWAPARRSDRCPPRRRTRVARTHAASPHNNLNSTVVLQFWSSAHKYCTQSAPFSIACSQRSSQNCSVLCHKPLAIRCARAVDGK